MKLALLAPDDTAAITGGWGDNVRALHAKFAVATDADGNVWAKPTTGQWAQTGFSSPSLRAHYNQACTGEELLAAGRHTQVDDMVYELEQMAVRCVGVRTLDDIGPAITMQTLLEDAAAYIQALRTAAGCAEYALITGADMTVQEALALLEQVIGHGSAGPFWSLVAIARTLLANEYPPDVFGGGSGDPGPVFVNHLRQALDALPVRHG